MSAAGASEKKPYQSPKLVVYGTLTEMTKMIGKMGMGDGGMLINRTKTGR